MRVIYMTDEFHTVSDVPKLAVGSEYNVTKEHTIRGLDFFELSEIRHPVYTYVYDQRGFATLPSQSADEINEEAKEAILM